MDISQSVREDYGRWKDFMEKDVSFWLPDSVIHTKQHCARVLLLCLIMAERLGLTDGEKETLALASCFHDSRRLDDGRDIGHGQRAADYYRTYSLEKAMPFNERAFFIMAYHDCHDETSLRALRQALPDDAGAIRLYEMFKDSDALDRIRLGPYGLDIKRLRTDAARELVAFSRSLFTNGVSETLGHQIGKAGNNKREDQ